MSKKDSLNFLKPQSKQDNLNFLKIQNCVLKVNVHCEGCKKKVQKILQKIDGVYTVSVDAEHGKVTVSSSVDPYTLIKKLGKAGKHAELLSPKGTINAINNSNKNNKKSNGSNLDFLNDQLKKLKLDSWKGGGGGQEQEKKKDNGTKPKKGLITGGLKDEKGEHNLMKLPQTQLKALSFPAQKDQQKNVKFSLPHDFDDGSDFDDLDDDDDDDELYDDYDDSELDDLDDDIYEDRSVGSNKGGAKKEGDGAKDGKNGDKNNNKNNNNNKGSEKNQVLATSNNNNHQQHKMMGHIGHQAGMAATAINPYQQQQQQYMQQLMRQQQQQQMMMMNGPTVYGQPMGYIPAAGPPVYGEPYGNYFSDDNTNNCSIM